MKLKDSLCLFVLIVFTTILLTIGFARPSVGHHDANNRMYALAGLNYLDKGVIALSFGQLMQPVGNPIVRENFYTHHPPILSLLLAVSMGLFGYTSWAIRLVPILFSLGTIVVFFLLLRKFFSLPITLLGCFLWIGTPMFLLFGKMADHEALTLLFIVVASYAFVTKRSRLMLVSLFIGQWTGWPAYYAAAILFVFTRKFSLILLSLGNFALFLVHLIILTGSPIGGGLVEIILFRMGLKEQLGQVIERYTMMDFIKQEVSWTIHFFNPAQIWLALLGGAFALWKRYFGVREKVVIVFFFVAFVHVILFRTGAHRHDYWLYYFLPFYSFAAALGLHHLHALTPKKYRFIFYLVAVGLVLVAAWQGEPFFWALQNRVEATPEGVPL